MNNYVVESDDDLILDWKEEPKRKKKQKPSNIRQEVLLLLDNSDESKETERKYPARIPKKIPKTKPTNASSDSEVVVLDDSPLPPPAADDVTDVASLNEEEVDPHIQALNQESTDSESDVHAESDDENVVYLESDPEEKMNTLGSTGQMPVKETVGVRIQYKGSIKRIKVPKHDSFRSIYPAVKQEFNLTSDVIICLERENGEKIKPDSTPGDLTHFNFMTDILLIEFISASSSNEASTSNQNHQKTQDTGEECPEGFIPVKVREKVVLSHGECLPCITSCSKCSKSCFLMTEASNKSRKQVDHKERVKEQTSLEGFMNDFRMKLLSKKNIPLEDHPLLKLKFEFDGDELLSDQTPEDLEMEADSLIDVKIIDSRKCKEVVCKCKPTKRTARRRSTGRK